MSQFNQFRNDFADEVYRKSFQNKEAEAQEAKPSGELTDALEEEVDDFDENEVYKPHRLNLKPTERFGLMILSCLLALVTVLALNVNGIHVVRIAKKTVYRVLMPHKVLTRDPFKNQDEDTSDDVIVIRRTD